MRWDEASVKFLVILGSAVFYVVYNYSSHYTRKDFPALAGHALGIFLKSHFNLMCFIILQGSSLFFSLDSYLQTCSENWNISTLSQLCR